MHSCMFSTTSHLTASIWPSITWSICLSHHTLLFSHLTKVPNKIDLSYGTCGDLVSFPGREREREREWVSALRPQAFGCNRLNLMLVDCLKKIFFFFFLIGLSGCVVKTWLSGSEIKERKKVIDTRSIKAKNGWTSFRKLLFRILLI